MKEKIKKLLCDKIFIINIAITAFGIAAIIFMLFDIATNFKHQPYTVFASISCIIAVCIADIFAYIAKVKAAKTISNEDIMNLRIDSAKTQLAVSITLQITVVALQVALLIKGGSL